jgi:Ser/Thr protein kinase RdoA (MazF antagonist)
MSQNPTNVMEQQDLRPQLTIEQVRTLLFSEYSIATKVLKPLESERDQNFYVQDNFGREFVFKVSNVEEDFGMFSQSILMYFFSIIHLPFNE